MALLEWTQLCLERMFAFLFSHFLSLSFFILGFCGHWGLLCYMNFINFNLLSLFPCSYLDEGGWIRDVNLSR